MLRSVSEPETIAAHMYRMAMMSFLIPSDSELNRVKIMEMALVNKINLEIMISINHVFDIILGP